jgi:hypothetical protein
VTKTRVHSINFGSVTHAWLDNLVDLLRQTGPPQAGRSEVVRVALTQFRPTLERRMRVETVRLSSTRT